MTYLDEIEARVNAATQGQWRRMGPDHDPFVFGPRYDAADAEFVAHAPEDVRAMLRALRAVDAVLTRWEGFDVVDEARAAIRNALAA